MRKGQKKRVWTPAQKIEIVTKHLEKHISAHTLKKEYCTEHGMICSWTKKTFREGATAFAPKVRPGNRL